MWMDELTKVRRYLRDPDGNIWTEPFLRHLWNDVQNDLQNRTRILEDVIAQRIPDLYHMSYLFDWEWSYLNTQYSEFYQALRKHDEYVFCYAWEPQHVTGISTDTEEVGCHFTQPWEAFMGLTPGEEIRMKFPKNYRSVKYIAYDEEPIVATTRKRVQSTDASYLTHTGEPTAYYLHESLDRSYVLYPMPSTAFLDDPVGEGVAFFVEDDTESSDTGTIAIRTGSSETSNVGASVDIVGVANNVLLIYEIRPTEVETISSEIDFPAFMTKYVRYGVLARAFASNTDGNIPSLARLWGERYELGVRTVKKYMQNRLKDRDYRMTTRPTSTPRSRRLPRLPDTYPASA